MAVILTVIAVAFVIGIAAPATWWTLTRHGSKNPTTNEAATGWLDDVTRRRLLVNTLDGQTIDGQLVRVDSDGIILQPASLADGPVALHGEVWVPRERVAWVQHPTG